MPPSARVSLWRGTAEECRHANKTQQKDYHTTPRVKRSEENQQTNQTKRQTPKPTRKEQTPKPQNTPVRQTNPEIQTGQKKDTTFGSNTASHETNADTKQTNQQKKGSSTQHKLQADSSCARQESPRAMTVHSPKSRSLRDPHRKEMRERLKNATKQTKWTVCMCVRAGKADVDLR